MEYISKLTEKQVEKILDLTSDGSSSWKFGKNSDGTFYFWYKDRHPGYAYKGVKLDDFSLKIRYDQDGYHDYSEDFRLFMMQQKNIDAVQYVKDLETYIFEQETIKIDEIKEKAKKKIHEVRQKADNDRLFYRNMLQIKQANPDLKISL